MNCPLSSSSFRGGLGHKKLCVSSGHKRSLAGPKAQSGMNYYPKRPATYWKPLIQPRVKGYGSGFVMAATKL